MRERERKRERNERGEGEREEIEIERRNRRKGKRKEEDRRRRRSTNAAVFPQSACDLNSVSRADHTRAALCLHTHTHKDERKKERRETGRRERNLAFFLSLFSFRHTNTKAHTDTHRHTRAFSLCVLSSAASSEGVTIAAGEGKLKHRVRR